jgi:hypothetical protein
MSRRRSQSLAKWSIFASPRSCRTPIPPLDLMLAPLSEGKHSLHFTGTFPQFNFAINVTYNLTVRPRSGAGELHLIVDSTGLTLRGTRRAASAASPGMELAAMPLAIICSRIPAMRWLCLRMIVQFLRESASSKALASAAASRPRAPCGLATLRRRLVLGPASVQECPLGNLVDKRTFRIMYLAGIASRSLTFDWLGLGFRATCFDGDLHGTFHRIFEGHLDSEQSVLVGRFSFVRFHRPT